MSAKYLDDFDPPDEGCKRCGGDMEWIDCYQCGGEGCFDGYEDDPLWYDPGEYEDCTECDGAGGWIICRSCEKSDSTVTSTASQEKP